MDDLLKEALFGVPDEYRNKVSGVAYMALLSGEPIDEVVHKTQNLASMLQAVDEVVAENNKK